MWKLWEIQSDTELNQHHADISGKNPIVHTSKIVKIHLKYFSNTSIKDVFYCERKVWSYCGFRV